MTLLSGARQQHGRGREAHMRIGDWVTWRTERWDGHVTTRGWDRFGIVEGIAPAAQPGGPWLDIRAFPDDTRRARILADIVRSACTASVNDSLCVLGPDHAVDCRPGDMEPSDVLALAASRRA
jgi:hypothetical protein